MMPKEVMFILIGVLVAATASAATQSIREEAFGGDSVAPEWKQVLGKGATITVKDGWATFEAPVGGECHIQQPAPGDDITLSAHLARWAGVYLVWDQNNWAGIGKISPTPFGRFYSIVVSNGKPSEIDHRGIDFNGRHDVRVQLGSDHVSFQYQLDGKWTDLRTIERPSGFKGAPKLVAAGIAYTDQDRPFGKSGVGPRGSGFGSKQNSVSSPEARNPKPETRSGAMDDLRIEPTPHDALKLTAAQLEAVRHPPEEPVNALLHKSDEDPTYEKIVGYYPPFRSPRELVGVPDHPKDIGVDWLGRIDVSPWTPPLAWFEIGDPPKPLFDKPESIKRRLRDGYLPLLSLRRDADNVAYSMEVLGWSKQGSPDQDLYAYVAISAQQLKADAKVPRRLWLVWDGGKQRREIKPLYAKNQIVEWKMRFKFPDPSTVERVWDDEFNNKANQTAAFLQGAIGPARPIFDLPDQRVMDAYRAWIAYSTLDTDTINGYKEPHDGSGFYEEMFGYSVSLHTMAMDQYGLHDRAASVLKTQIHFQQPDGLYTQACGLCDPGSFLAALAMHYKMTGDKAWLKEVSPAIIKQCDWLIKQRQQSPKEGMLKGLIKFRPYNDFPAPTYNYLGNAWCARGMILAGQVLKEIGNPRADPIAAEGEQYRKDIVSSMEQSAFAAPAADNSLSGSGDRDLGNADSDPKPEARNPKPEMLLPMEPDTHRLLKMGKNEGGDYWGLIASPLLATDIMSPQDKPAKWIVDMLEKRGGLIAGVCEFERGIDHAYTYGYLLNELKQNETRKTLLGFWSFLAFGMTRDTYSPVEVTMIKTGENQYTLPHLYSCTQQLRLLRAMLLREEGDVLILGQGIPRAWLKPGEKVRIRNAPTTFGQMSYMLSPSPNGGIYVRIDPPRDRPAKEIQLYLREPGQRAIAKVTSPKGSSFPLPAGAQVKHDRQKITLKGVTGTVELMVSFEK